MSQPGVAPQGLNVSHVKSLLGLSPLGKIPLLSGPQVCLASDLALGSVMEKGLVGSPSVLPSRVAGGLCSRTRWSGDPTLRVLPQDCPCQF